MKLSSLTAFAVITLMSSHAMAEHPFVDPGTIQRIHDAGGTIDITGDSITITGPNTPAMDLSHVPLFAPSPGPIITVTRTIEPTLSQPLVITGGSINIIPENTASAMPGVSSNYQQAVEFNTEKGTPTLTGMDKPLAQNAQDMASLSPSAGSDSNDIYAAANARLRANGLGGL